MAVPKKRQSRSRRDKRRTHYKLSAPGFILCPNCKEPTMPHTICQRCGTYKGKKFIEVEEL
ncbi:MAG: 50S ribosomal protein L32 [Deltaproteobacteria bacterium]|nr:50S ribosomal protein L32 [Deltaproteobacteria bacterium]